MKDGMDTDPDGVQSPNTRLDLGAIRKRVMKYLNCTLHYVDSCEELDYPVHQNARPPPTKPLYRGALSHYNQVTPIIDPPSLPHFQWQLYEVFDKFQEEEN